MKVARSLGAGSETRTRDLSFTKALLYQLSYPGRISIVKPKESK